jgi:hypothetical protein
MAFVRRLLNFISVIFRSCLLKRSNTGTLGQAVGDVVASFSKTRLSAHIPEFDAHAACKVPDVCDRSCEKES